MNKTAKIVINRYNFNLTRFYLGKIKYVIYETKQRISCRFNILRVRKDRLVFSLPEDHLVHSEHCIYRSADLMRHIGKE